MTKEQFAEKWGWNIVNNAILSDLESVIAHEIAKAKEPQPELNPIEQAYERGVKIRFKKWSKNEWIKKHSKTNVINEIGNILDNTFEFNIYPNAWELYTEPAEQTSSQVKVDNSFDKDRFEAMFRAVVASGQWENCEIGHTEFLIEKLDAYYASKEGGNNE